MSIGRGANARLVLQDEQTVTYQYCSYDLNKEELKKGYMLFDGTILIQKSCFPSLKYIKVKKESQMAK